MECQSTAGPGAAPASISAADISALPPESVGQGSLVTEDHREVSPVSRGVMLPEAQPLSGRLQAGVGLLPDPLPAAPWARLAVRFPWREDDGLTTLHRCTKGGEGRSCSPVVRHLRRGMLEPPDLTTHLLVQAYQHLWLVLG